MHSIEAHRREREIHWFDFAQSYLAVVRDAVRQAPHDRELRQLMVEMEAAMATQPGPAQ